MPQVWGMLRDPDVLLSCVRACLQESSVSVLLPWRSDDAPESVMVLGPLTREVSPYPFLDLTRHFLRLGMDRRTAVRYADGIAQGWCIICIDGREDMDWRRLPLRHAASFP